MPRSIKTYLWDIQDACRQIMEFTEGRTLDDYRANEMMRGAVERALTIIGEAVGQMRRIDPRSTEAISYADQIVGFRNRLIHGYHLIDHRQVWDILQKDVPVLRDEVNRLLEQAEDIEG